MSQVTAILDFWFGDPNQPGYSQPQQFWFNNTPEFDQEIRIKFLEDYQQAANGELNDWINAPLSCLALILLLDQFPRNMFRNTPQAFANDREALSAAKHAISQGYDRDLLPVQRWFIYLPFEHSENLEEQNTSIKLFQQLSNDLVAKGAIDYALRHKQVIEKFGRFPHRNQILGRKSTPSEEEFLKQHPSGF